MPTYGYRCPACSREFEVIQRMTDEAGADCPACGTASRRVFFPAGIVFKGSGFYKTDSRRPDSNGAPTPTGTGSSSAPSTSNPAGDSSTKDSGSAKDSSSSKPSSSPSKDSSSSTSSGSAPKPA